MIKINIVKAGNITNSAQFENRELSQVWIDKEVANRSFGKPAYSEIVFDETGKEVGTIPHEAEYTVEILDITAEVEAEKTKRETKKLDRVSRIDQLKAINWVEIDTVKELKEIVKLLAKEAIKDEE